MPSDPSVRLFQSMTSELEELIKRYKKLFRMEEQFPSLFNKTEAFSDSFTRPISSAIVILKEAQTTYENFQQVNLEFFLTPLKRISDILPSISKLTSEREYVIKELDKSNRKCQKLETCERTGENLAKLSKHKRMVEYFTERRDTIDALLGQALPDLVAKTEAFFGRVLRAHLNWKYQSCIASATANHELAGLFCDPRKTADLTVLEKDMNEAMEEIHRLSLVRPKP